MEITYEELMALPDDDTRLRWIIDRLTGAFPALRRLDPPAALREPLRHRKQDASTSLEDKISNFQEFCSGLVQRGLGHHLPAEAAR